MTCCWCEPVPTHTPIGSARNRHGEREESLRWSDGMICILLPARKRFLSSFDRLSSQLLHIALAFNALFRCGDFESPEKNERRYSIDVIVGVYFQTLNGMEKCVQRLGMLWNVVVFCLPFTPWKPLRKWFIESRCDPRLLTEEGSTCALLLLRYANESFAPESRKNSFHYWFLFMKIQWRYPVLLFAHQYLHNTAVATVFIFQKRENWDIKTASDIKSSNLHECI